MTVERRDQLFRRCFLCLGGGLLVLYIVLDLCGCLPVAISVTQRSVERWRSLFGRLPDRYETFDPDLCLGIAVGDTRYRFNYPKRIAIVTRPLFGVTDWEIPEEVEYDGVRYDVCALDPFAFLNAVGVESIRVPASIRYTNGAEELPAETLRRVTLCLPEGGTREVAPGEPFGERQIEPPGGFQ